MELKFKEVILLENKRVRLEPLSKTHLAGLLPISLAHPQLLQYSPSLFGDETKLNQYIQIALEARLTNSRYAFAIFDREHQRYVGSTSFGAVSNYDKRLEIGWTWLDPVVQGTGLNQECKYLLLHYAFEELKFDRVEFKTDSRNLQSRRAIEKIGGTYEGELRSHTLLADGFRRNTVYYSILAAEWMEFKKSIFGH